MPQIQVSSIRSVINDKRNIITTHGRFHRENFSNQVMLEKRNISEEFNSSVFEIAVRIFQIIFYKITDCEH